MRFHELKARVARLPGLDVASAAYLIDWASDGRPGTAALTLVPQRGGTVTAMFGDNRTKVEVARDAAGEPLVFTNETDACEWAWEWIQERTTQGDDGSGAGPNPVTPSPRRV